MGNKIWLAVGFTLVGAAFAQKEALPAFDAADVHVSPHMTNPRMRGGIYQGGRYEVRSATMVDLIRAAWDLDDDDKVVGGPGWLDSARFDVLAKAPSTATPQAVRLMLRMLLAERFRLVARETTEPLEAYVLGIGKRAPFMKPAVVKEGDATTATGCQNQPQPPAEPGAIPHRVFACHNITMGGLVGVLSDVAGAYLGSYRLLDQTGLQGGWDFTLKFTGRAQLVAAGSDGISLSDAIDKQLGLKLELRKVPTPVIVVERANEQPTPNPAGVTSKLPVPPAEFEVADIKPSLSDGPNTESTRSGRVEFRATSMRRLIQLAWGISNEEFLSGPKWLDSQTFDIVARAPVEAFAGMDDEVFQLMLRNLLIDRFKMTVHNEDRPVTVYALTTVKPKLTKGDPANRGTCKSTPPATGVNSRSFTCRNVGMAQLAEKLPGIAFNFIDHPVVDETRLNGGWDFAVSFSPARLIRSEGSSDPTGRVTLFEALEKQAGLKLEARKAPMSVLVIDHIEQKPTEN